MSALQKPNKHTNPKQQHWPTMQNGTVPEGQQSGLFA